MWKVIKINLLVGFFLILLVEIILISLNFLFDGVPMYRHFNLKGDQVISYKKYKFQSNNLDAYDQFYVKTFDEYNKKKYLEDYLNKNQLTQKQIRWIKGTDVNFPIFLDKHGCRENLDEYYINSDTILIGDSSLFGYAIASPHDIVGKLRQLNSSNTFLNLGIPGSGPLGQVRHLKKVAEDTNFKNLIWFFVEANDYEDINPAADCGYHHKEPDNLFNTHNVNSDIFISIKIFLSEHFRGLASFSKLFINYENKFNLDKEEYEKTTLELKKFLDKKNVKNRYLYYLPYYNRHSYKNDFFTHPNVKKLNDLKDNVEKIVTKHGFVFIDGNDAVKEIKNKKNLYHYGYQTHYNAKGYTLTAQHLSDILNLNKN